MTYYDELNHLGIVIKVNMIDEIVSGCWAPRTTALMIPYQLLKSPPELYTEVSATLKVSCTPALKSQSLQNLNIL